MASKIKQEAMSSFIIVDSHQLEEMQQELHKFPNEIAKVTSRAINRGLDVMRTRTWKEIQNHYYGITQSELYQHITLVKSSEHKLSGAEIATAPHIPISKFRLTPPNPQPAKRPFVTFQIEKARVGYIPGSFVAVMQSGHKGLFVRETDARMPIQQKFTIGVAEMLEQHDIRKEVEKAGHEAFETEFDRQKELVFKKAFEHKE